MRLIWSEPDELPEHIGKQKVLIGEDVSERLDVVPAKFRVIVTRRPKYAVKNEDGVIQAAAPAHIIEGGIQTEVLLPQIAVSKYAGRTLPRISKPFDERTRKIVTNVIVEMVPKTASRCKARTAYI